MKKQRQISKGKCEVCGDTFNKAEMTKHLRLCKQKSVVSAKTSDKKKQKIKIFHLLVEGRRQPEYWLHLEVPANATLKDLDEFLRDIWLECCGHLSAFTIDGMTYASEPSKEYDDKSMNVKIGNLLSSGEKFYHEYDFGTTTELTLRVISEREGEIMDKDIQLLARNEHPQILCEVCGKIATQVCAQCIYEGKGWVCDKCASKHECGEDMLLPVVNSPRVGMCGYTSRLYEEE